MRYKNPQLLIIHTASELSWCVFLRPLELSVRVEPLFNCDDGCLVKPFWWHSGRGDCDFKSFSYEKMWFKLSTGSQNRISSWLGIFVRGHWNFLTVCYTHRCLDCGKKRGKELFTVSPTKNLTHRCRLCFFFSLVHMSYDSSGANCASMNCAQRWVSTSIFETQQRNWVKKRDKHREPIAAYKERRKEGERAMRYSHLQREHCCYNNFFLYFTRRFGWI